MNALYQAAAIPSARTIANQFSATEFRECRHELEELVEKNHADSMTLLGQLLEREGNKRRARTLYEEAIKLKETKFDPKELNALALRRIAPWNALGALLLSENSPESQNQAREAFQKGAFQGDDPVSYFHLASFEPRISGKWHQYMSKAAAAGHREAMHHLGHFYFDVASETRGKVDTSPLQDTLLAKSLSWLSDWKDRGAKDLGIEWFVLAAASGFKPSMLELADMYEMLGHEERYLQYLQMLVEPPLKDFVEEWPSIVDEGKRRLSKMRRLSAV
jgi:TPR repeat protein